MEKIDSAAQAANSLSLPAKNALLSQDPAGHWDSFVNPDINALQSLVPELLDHKRDADEVEYYRLTKLGVQVFEYFKPSHEISKEAARIADILSAAQRKTMIQPHKAEAIPVIIWAYKPTMRVLIRLGLTAQKHGDWYELSALGAAVREYLLKK